MSVAIVLFLIGGGVIEWMRRAGEERRLTATRALCDAIRDGNGEQARKLVAEYESVVSLVDVDGVTPLHCAAIKNDIDIAAMLLSRRSEIDAPDYRGQTPLFYAVRNGSVDMVRELLRVGAKAHVRDLEGNTPLTYAEQLKQDEITKILHGTQ
jgi:ankyrin repeat protein